VQNVVDRDFIEQTIQHLRRSQHQASQNFSQRSRHTNKGHQLNFFSSCRPNFLGKIEYAPKSEAMAPILQAAAKQIKSIQGTQ
jgi:hypothetical protein